MEEINLANLALHFSDEGEAYKLVESIRWPDGPVCPHCGHDGKHYFLNPKGGARKTTRGTTSQRRVWKCSKCRKQFSVLVGTIFHGTHIPLPKWLLAIHLMCSGKNGVSAFELHRLLGITYKSAWFMAHRIRLAMGRPPLVDKLSGIVEADETYIGGKRRGTPPGRPGLQSHKTPVFTLVERDGEARSQAMTRITGDHLGKILVEYVDTEATLMTDEYPSYRKPGQMFASHQTVNHSAGEYARGEVHTNTVEGFFGQLKTSLDGTYHHVSRQHLDRYLAEFDFRYTTRKITDGERTTRAIRQSTGKRLRYVDPVRIA